MVNGVKLLAIFAFMFSIFILVSTKSIVLFTVDYDITAEKDINEFMDFSKKYWSKRKPIANYKHT